MICTSPSSLPLPEKSISSLVAREQILFSSVGRELDLIRARLPNRARFDSSSITKVVTRARVGFRAMSSSVAQDPSSRVVTQARIGFRARVTYFELGCPETNIDPSHLYTFIHLFISHKGEKSWTFLESMERKVTNKLNSCKFYQMQEAIFLK